MFDLRYGLGVGHTELVGIGRPMFRSADAKERRVCLVSIPNRLGRNVETELEQSLPNFRDAQRTVALVVAACASKDKSDGNRSAICNVLLG